MEAFSLVPNLKIQRQTTQSSPRRRISTPSSTDDDTASGIEAWIYAAEWYLLFWIHSEVCIEVCRESNNGLGREWRGNGGSGALEIVEVEKLRLQLK